MRGRSGGGAVAPAEAAAAAPMSAPPAQASPAPGGHGYALTIDWDGKKYDLRCAEDQVREMEHDTELCSISSLFFPSKAIPEFVLLPPPDRIRCCGGRWFGLAAFLHERELPNVPGHHTLRLC